MKCWYCKKDAVAQSGILGKKYFLCHAHAKKKGIDPERWEKEANPGKKEEWRLRARTLVVALCVFGTPFLLFRIFPNYANVLLMVIGLVLGFLAAIGLYQLFPKFMDGEVHVHND